jgi:hypothetical protein
MGSGKLDHLSLSAGLSCYLQEYRAFSDKTQPPKRQQIEI